MLKLIDIKKDYPTSSMTVHALKGVSIDFRTSEFVSILGPSGCGKTTMLNIIGGLDRLTDGDLIINDRSTKDFKSRDWDVYRNHRIGFVFQSYNLIPHQTVLSNVELALTIAGIDKATRREKAKIALAKVGLADQTHKRPNQLSGGQCQRVAIARALVNDPEILLADEPTGALDTETSKQIMDLIQEISKERLVIMVTHNQELAAEYSTRIIRLLDGLLVSDSNPMSEAEIAGANKVLIQDTATHSDNGQPATADSADQISTAPLPSAYHEQAKTTAAKEKAKMSFFTAFRLSLSNLFTKKARTIMVAIAGSIGIIGISVVLSVSWGITGFIQNMQEDMLSGNPITIAETGFNLNALMQEQGVSVRNFEMNWQGGRTAINVNDTVASLIRRMDDVEDIFVENEITQDYIDYILYFARENPDILAEVMLGFGLNFTNNIFANFTPAQNHYTDGQPLLQSLASIRAIYSAILDASAFDDFAPFIASLENPFSPLPQNEDFVLNQYDMIAGRFATEKDEVMIIVQRGTRLSDLFLAQTGIFSQNEFMNMVIEATYHHEDNMNHFRDPYAPPYGNRRHHFSFTDLGDDGVYFDHLNDGAGGHLEFMFYPSATVFRTHTQGELGNDENGRPILDGQAQIRHLANYNALDPVLRQTIENGGTGLPLRVVGILEPNEDLSFGSLSSGFFYNAALRDFVMQQEYENPSPIVQILQNADNNAITSLINANHRQGGMTQEQVNNLALMLGVMIGLPAGVGIPLDMVLPAEIQFLLGTTRLYDLIGDEIIRTTVEGIYFEFEYVFPYHVLRDTNGNIVLDNNGNVTILPPTTRTNLAAVGSANPFAAMAGMFANMIPPGMGGMFAGSTLTLRELSGQNDSGIPMANFISLYSTTFANTIIVREHLDAWNHYEGYIHFVRPNGEQAMIAYDYRQPISYTDFLGLMINMLTQLVDMITIALISFLSLSLLVSTVMIGIITYVSVVERTKEIGVIRSLGGRKIDVAYLFNAETGIIGFVAGTIGIVITYLLSGLINLIVGYFQPGLVIASFPWFFALLMVGISVFLTVLAGIIPSRSASRKDPVVALRTE